MLMTWGSVSLPRWLSYQALGMVAHHLNKLIRVGLVKRIGDRYLIRDACPSCFRRVCSEECKLHFGGEFAPRRLNAVV